MCLSQFISDEIQLKENPEKTTPEASTSQAVMINMADKDDPSKYMKKYTRRCVFIIFYNFSGWAI